MNIYSPNDTLIVKEKKPNGQLHLLKPSHQTRTGALCIESLSDEELDHFKGSMLVDSDGCEWDPTEVEKYIPYERLTSL